MKFGPETLTLLLLLTLNIIVSHGQSFTQQRNPIIASVNPSFGGMEGGTEINIYGTNFASDFLFTESVVFIGNEICEMVSYKTNNNMITCKTPKCYDQACLDLSNSAVYVTISVYVQTVEGILYDDSVFRYYSYYTNKMHAMQSTTYGSTTAWLNVYTRNALLEDMDVVYDDSFHGNLGTNDELNPDEFSYYHNEKVV